MQVYNPFLPLDVCIADGEPHVFGDRIYIFGSHDRVGGNTFCELDYEVWSAPLDNLKDWKSHGIVYKASQDAAYSERKPYLFAPDVVCGNDGKYYLYYSLAGLKGKHGYEGPISVAVCDEPAGKYEYLGYVQNPGGSPFNSRVVFDPCVVNDDGTIRLYFGTSYFFDEYKRFTTRSLFEFIESKVFDRKFKEIHNCKGGVTGAFHVKLADDMRTVTTEPVRIAPIKTNGTDFKGHAFFEAISIRKFGDLYYFVYSSRNNHELCYAVSKFPDKGFAYGGTIVSNGDIGLNGRKAKTRIALTGNNHGSIEKVGDKYYIFYHRMTNKSTYSRQACAEEVKIDNGKISQVEITSCGLNGGALKAKGKYSAAIACNLVGGKMPHLVNGKSKKDKPYITHENFASFITRIKNGTKIGFKYFDFSGECELIVKTRGSGSGKLTVSTEFDGRSIAELSIKGSTDWQKSLTKLSLNGKHPLYLTYKGKGVFDMLSIEFK